MLFLFAIQYVYHIGVFGHCLPACARCSGGLGCRTTQSLLLRVTEAEQRRGGQEPVYQSETKALLHDYREGLKLLGAYITSQEVAQHKAAIPTKPSPRFPHSFRSLSSTQKYLTCYYSPPAPPLIVNRSSHRNAMHFRYCDFGGIISVSLSPSFSLHSLKLCALSSRSAESGLFHCAVYVGAVCPLYISCLE